MSFNNGEKPQQKRRRSGGRSLVDFEKSKYEKIIDFERTRYEKIIKGLENQLKLKTKEYKAKMDSSALFEEKYNIINKLLQKNLKLNDQEYRIFVENSFLTENKPRKINERNTFIMDSLPKKSRRQVIGRSRRSKQAVRKGSVEGNSYESPSNIVRKSYKNQRGFPKDTTSMIKKAKKKSVEERTINRKNSDSLPIYPRKAYSLKNIDYSRKKWGKKKVEVSEEVLKALIKGIGETLTNNNDVKNEKQTIQGEMKRDFIFKTYGKKIFKDIRQFNKFTEEGFLKSMCESSLTGIMSPGKSGALLFFTEDKKFVIKTVTRNERKLLANILPSYHRYLRANPNSFLIRILGLYKLGFEKKIDTPMQFIVMNNVFPNERPDTIYDLKGSLSGRMAGKEEKTLKDWDLMINDTSINVCKEKKQIMLKQLKKDSKFLMHNNIMDYSLILGVHKKKCEAKIGITSPIISQQGSCKYYMGIIDILQEWNLKKKVEGKIKSVAVDSSHISAVEPKAYAKRFMDYLSDILQ